MSGNYGRSVYIQLSLRKLLASSIWMHGTDHRPGLIECCGLLTVLMFKNIIFQKLAEGLKAEFESILSLKASTYFIPHDYHCTNSPTLLEPDMKRWPRKSNNQMIKWMWFLSYLSMEPLKNLPSGISWPSPQLGTFFHILWWFAFNSVLRCFSLLHLTVLLITWHLVLLDHSSCCSFDKQSYCSSFAFNDIKSFTINL